MHVCVLYCVKWYWLSKYVCVSDNYNTHIFVLYVHLTISVNYVFHCLQARDINELVGKAFKLAFANKHQKKQKEKKHKKEASHTSQETDLDKTPSSASCVNNSVNHGSNSSHHNSSQIHDPQQFRIVEERQLKETIDRLDEELLKLNIENFDLESYFNAYERDKGSEQYLKALTTYETNRRVIHQKSIILERMQSQYRQLISNNNENLTANRNSK